MKPVNRKDIIPFLILICTGFLISFLYCPPFDMFFDDKEIFKYTGMAIAKGGVPYLAFFDHKPPLIYFLNLLQYQCGPWFFWFLDTLLVCYTAWVFYRLCREAKMRFSILLPLVFLLLIRNPVFSYGIGMTREYSTIFLLLFLCFTFSKVKTKYLQCGILAALLFFMQQDQVVLLVPFAAYTFFNLLKKDKKKAVKYISFLFAGFLCIAIPILLYLGINHALYAFWEDAFLFNMNWYSEKLSLSNHFKIINNLLFFSKTDFIYYSTLILLTFSLFLYRGDKKIIIAAIFTILLSFISEFLTGKISIGLSLRYYALPIAATVPFGLYILFTETGFPDRVAALHPLMYISVFSFPLILGLLAYATNVSSMPLRAELTKPEIRYLDSIPLKDHELFVAFDANYDFLYNRHKILSPSPWLYLNFWQWYGNWDPQNTKLNAITTDLEKYQTRFIINFADSNKIKNKVNMDFWSGYMQQKYIAVRMPDSSYSKFLFIRK